MHGSDDFSLAEEIIPSKLYFVPLRRPDGLRTSHIASSNICFSIDDELLYEPFFADFGPLNLGKAHRFCRKVLELLQEGERANKRVYYYCGPHAQQKANAAALVGIYQVIYLNKSAEEAYKPLSSFKPFVPFRDASCGVSTFHLTVFDVIKGVQKARDVGFIDWNSGSSAWSIEEYEHYEQVENGDLNWIVPGKLVAFSGPAARGNEIAGYRLHTPEDYWNYYRKKGVTAVVRLNKKVYDRKRFTDGGFRHYDLYFPDGSCPSETILLKFLDLAENEPGALAVHCKAGLGRTGVLICCYMMKHFKFTAEEVIGYIRVCRPGSVIGPQQNFLRDVEARMWHEGDLNRQQRGINKPHLGLQDLVINGRSTTCQEPEAAGACKGSSGVAVAGQRPQRSDSAYSITNATDLSLLQYKLHLATAAPTSPQPMVSQHSNGYGPVTPGQNGRSHARYSNRSITPLRCSGGSGLLLPSYGILGPQPVSPHSSKAPGSSTVLVTSKSMPTMPAMVRAPSADRALDRAMQLRATIHTDTLRAADRPRIIPERNAQSADMGAMHSWKINSAPTSPTGASHYSPPGSPTGSGASSPIATTPKAAPPGHKPNSGVARTLAPNGQPRKVPMAMLPQYHAAVGNRPSTMISAQQPDATRIKAVAQLRYGLHSK